MSRKKNTPWLWLGAGAAGVVALIYWKKSRDQAQAQVQTVAKMMAPMPKAQGDYFALG